MHTDKQKPRYQLRLLEYEKDGVTFKKGSKNTNIYPNSDDIPIDRLWKRMIEVIQKK